MLSVRQKSAFALIFMASLFLGSNGETLNGVAGAGYRIAGTVVSSIDGHPLARARVVLADVKNSRKPLSVLSSEDGSFVFPGLPAAKYSLQGAKRGYLTQSYDQHEIFSTAIVTGAGVDTEHLILRLLPDAYIVGKILDENGDPVRHANVTLYRVAHDEGTSQVQPNRSDTTDDLGAYELGPVLPGTYFVSVRAEPWYAVRSPASTSGDGNALPRQIDSGLDVAYPLTYYGDTGDPHSATPIQVRGGDRMQADFHLAPVPSLHVLIRTPQNGYPQIRESGLGGETHGVPVNMERVDTGLWDVSGLPQGKYALSISGPGAGETTVSALGAITEGQEIDATAAEPLGSMNISVQIPGEGRPTGPVSVGLRVPHGILRYLDNVDSKGVAHLKSVAAGRYEVVAWDNRGRYSVSGMAVTGGESADEEIELKAGASAEASVTLVRGNATVEGIVKQDGKAAAGAMVVLVPANATAHLDLFRRDQTDLDGTFAVNAVVPGEYTLVAIENAWDLEWSHPDVLAPYLRQGRKINVAPGTNGSFKVEEPVAVQQTQ